MCSTFPYIFCCFLLILSLALLALAQSPPQLNINNSTVEQKIARPGASTTIECPVRYTRNIIFEWYKDNEYIMTYAGQRLRVLYNGSLRIKEVTFDDTGVYRCRAVNGFGSVEHNVTLLVMGRDADYDQYEDVSDEPISAHESKISLTAEPHFLFISNETSPIIRKPGTTLRLLCIATGYPRPKMMWYKDGKPVPHVLRFGKWSLKITKALSTDNGNYTCVARNILGKVSHSWVLIVDDKNLYAMGKPLLSGRNTTIHEGERAELECGVESESFPHIEWEDESTNRKPLVLQWLKRIDINNKPPNDTRIAIPMDDEYYYIIQKPYSIDYMIRNGAYNHKLIIQNAQMADAGKYICLGANSYGYEYRFTFLFVIPNNPSFSESVPFPIVVTIVVGIAAVGVIAALLLYCRPRQANGSGGTSTTGAPMATKEFIPMHPGPFPSRPALKPHRSRSKQQVDQQVVYVAGQANGVV